ncbi:DUF2799 domain-containing protein [Rhizobium sp. G187]|uniref:DUF2799 domain-containing protein n=1 Tax=Rhizobium sp. G187 TaxID=3451352 RepID=UPI003EE6F28B
MRIYLWAAVGMALAALSSCNSMSKEECAAADWSVIGQADGGAGENPQERFAAHVKSCARINVVPDQTQWYQGYQVGLTRYCTPLNGLSRGEAGDAYYNVCPAETSAGFLRGYGLGQQAYRARSRISSLKSDVSFKDMQIDRNYDAIKRTEDGKMRRTLRDEIDRLERDIRRAEREIADLEFDLYAIERDVEAFRRNPNGPVPGY